MAKRINHYHEKEHPLEQMSMKRSYRLFVGVDIAYQTFTAASLLPGTKTKREQKPFEQTVQGFERFQHQLLKSESDPSAILVVMEATGSYWVALATTLHQAGFAVSVINPAQAHFFAKAQLKRAKNDALDAEILAELAQALLPACWTPPPQIYHELLQRLAQRASLLELRTQVNNQLHALSVSPVVVASVRERLVSLIETFNLHIAQLDTELLNLVRIKGNTLQEQRGSDENSDADGIASKWKMSIGLLLTIPGIGLLTACWLVVTTLDFTVCETAEAAAHFVGLAPVIRTSGTSVRSRAQIGRCGHARARSQLYLATLTAARFNPIIKTFYDRLREAGKPMKVARCACARKLLHIAFAVVTHQQPFDPSYQFPTQAEGAIA
jgi:transposase